MWSVLMKYTKSIVAMMFILLTFFPAQFAAAESSGVQNETVVAAQSYKSRWDQVGGSWTTGWVRNQAEPVCFSAAHCKCNGQDLCGKFHSGQTNYWWPRGCQASPMKIQCTSVPD
jgi:hypothetical protein